VDEDFGGGGRAAGVEEARVNIHAGKTVGGFGEPLLLGNPGDDEAAAGQGGEGRGALGERGELVDEKFTADLLAGGRKELGVDILEALLSALPDEGGATAVEKGDTRPFLVGHANLVDAKRGERAGETAVEAQGADAEAVAIGEIIFPDQEAAGGFEGKLRMDL